MCVCFRDMTFFHPFGMLNFHFCGLKFICNIYNPQILPNTFILTLKRNVLYLYLVKINI
jgi:hypothetical protein